MDKKNKIIFTVYALIFSFIFSFLIIGFAFFTYKHESKDFTDSLIQKDSLALNLGKKLVSNLIEQVYSDLFIILRSSTLNKYINLQNKGVHKKELESNIIYFLYFKKIFDQFRFLDENGMEMIRVDYKNGKPQAVAQDKLQNKKNRYYFRDTFKLADNNVFISPLDLNFERGKPEIPLKPMMRFATPVFSEKGIKEGIVILNYLAENMLNKLKNIINVNNIGTLIMLNSDGYYLIGQNGEDEWGFNLPERSAKRFSETFSEEYKKIYRETEGNFYSKNGLFVFNTIYPAEAASRQDFTLLSTNGSRTVFGESTKELRDKGYFWKIILYTPENIIYRQSYLLIKNTIIYVVVLVLAFIITSLLLSYLIVKNLESKELHLKEEKIKSLGSISAGIAHDFNNTLQGLIARIEVMLSKELTKEDLMNNLLRIKDIAELSSDRIRQLLNFSKKTEEASDQATSDLTEIIRNSVDEAKLIIEKEAIDKNISFTIRQTGKVFVRGDAGTVSSVVLNVIKNSIDAIDLEGSVTIDTLVKKTNAHVIISDSGSGMTKETAKKVFEPFFTTKEIHKGSGIGLSGVYATLRNLNGSIHLKETKLGKGTVFEIVLPVALNETVKTTQDGVEYCTIGKTAKILWVDDDQDIREMGKVMLEILGHEAGIASSGSEALNMIQADNYHIVITDIGMPEMDGWELSKLINKNYPQIKIIVLSGWKHEATDEKLGETEIACIIQKPINKEQLRIKINETINSTEN